MIFVKFALITIILELGFALFIGVRKPKEYLLIALVQIITNPLAVFFSLWAYSHITWPIHYWQFPLEILVVIVEGLIYKKYLTSQKRPFAFSLGANYFSYSLGIILQTFDIM